MGRVVAVVAVCAAIAELGAVPLAEAQCVPTPGLFVCPPPTTAAPAVRITAPEHVQDESATFTGTINPGRLSTTYRWVYTTPSQGLYGDSTAQQTLPPASTPQAIRTVVDRLIPGRTYSLTLIATNADGTTQATLQNAFTTGEHPSLQFEIRRPQFAIGDPYLISVHLGGTYDSPSSLRLYVAKSPFRKWVDASADGPPTINGSNVTVQPCNRLATYGCPWLDRNFKIQARLGPAGSSVKLIYVVPKLTLVVRRENAGSSPWLDATLAALVHPLPGRYPSPQVFFYVTRTRKGPLRRFGVTRFRVAAREGIYGTELHATARLYTKTVVRIVACFRHRLVRDMGAEFTNSKCGQPVVR